MARTTRSLSLTDPGEYFYQESLSVIDRIETIRETLESHQSKPVGKLRITSSVAVGRYFIGPRIADFLHEFPDIEAELQLTDEVLDMGAHSIDVAIRSMAKLKDSSLLSIKLASPKRVLVAAPEYIEARGAPTSPQELENHFAVVYRAKKIFNRWELRRGKQTWRVSMDKMFVSNDYETVLQAARGGAGVANLFDYLIGDDLKSGKLVAILSEYQQEHQNIFALYHQKRALSPKLDAFLSFLESNKPR